MKKRNIVYEQYLDKVLGCWIGKSLGGIIGAPFESHKIFGDIQIDDCWPGIIYPNDDLDIQVVWLEMLEDVGSHFTSEDMVEYWQDRCWYNFAEYGAFLYNAQRGIHPPLSGSFNNDYYKESQGCPIRSEIWGCISPGCTDLALKFSKMDGELDHIDNSVWAEQFWAYCLSESFFNSDVTDILEKASRVIPVSSEIHAVYLYVNELYSQYAMDLRRTWDRLLKRYGSRDASKVQINFAFTLLALISGDGNLKNTVVNAINLGWDADCTAATAGAIIGAISGAKNLPQDWKNLMGANLTCDVNVRHKTASLISFAEDTCLVGLEVLQTLQNEITVENIPESVSNKLIQILKSRKDQPVLEFSVKYHDEPVLWREKDTKFSIIISFRGTEISNASYKMHYPEGVVGDIQNGNILLTPNKPVEVIISTHLRGGVDILWDRNILMLTILTSENEEYSYSFGLVGARQWKVYGPFWDAWDKKRFGEVCPYRNKEKTIHPIMVEGCQYIQEHEYVNLDTAYLKETDLFERKNISQEYFLSEMGIDKLNDQDYSGFVGEACFYFVREFISREPVDCILNIGCSGKLIVFIDGIEVLKETDARAWATRDFLIPLHCDSEKYTQVVIKAVRETDHMTVGMCFTKPEFWLYKEKGISYFIDSIGDKLHL